MGSVKPHQDPYSQQFANPATPMQPGYDPNSQYPPFHN
jgi:hypothetical protein